MRMKNFTMFRSLLVLAVILFAGSAMAQTVLLEEDFSKCTSSNADSPNTAISDINEKTAVTGWAITNVYEGEGNVKLGAGSKAGSITTPELDLSDATATYTLSFKACAWSGDKTTLKVSVDDQEAVEVTGLTNAGAPYAANLKEFSLEVKGTATSKITIASYTASKARFFLDDVKVTKMVAGEVADPSVKAPSLVSFGAIKIGTTLAKEVAIVGADLTDDLTVAVSGEAFSCETKTIAKDEAANAVLNVVFAPTAGGEYTGELVISGGGLAEAITVALAGEAVDLDGEGTQENPYTIADVMKLNNPKTTAWVKGVIVGFINGASIQTGANFTAEGAAASNLLIADAADVEDYTLCVPVQLPAGDVRNALNLADNAGNLGKEVLIFGSLEAYFTVAGIKSPSAFVLGGGDAIANVEAAAENAPVEVYTLGGVKVGNTLEGLAKGIYVVKQGDLVKKVIK